MYDFNDMLLYVKERLESANAIKPDKPHNCFRSRFSHISRVLNWCKRIEDDFDDLDKDSLYAAAIFHDVGYAYGKKNHANNSADIFAEYGKSHGFTDDYINKVVYLIKNHSNKELLKDENTSHELIILLEADLLDEEGALGLVWDLLECGMENPKSYYDTYFVGIEHSSHILNQDYMVTKKAKAYWDNKKKIIKEFNKELAFDLFIEDGKVNGLY